MVRQYGIWIGRLHRIRCTMNQQKLSASSGALLNLEQKICHKKSTVSDLSATVDFNLIHPLDYPPYSLLIYLKLLSQIVFSI